MSSKVQAVVDRHARSATITTDFDRSIEVVWTLWADPDRLAAWWGPPGVPTTVDRHDLVVGGRVEVTTHLPGSTVRGSWSILDLDPPRALRFSFSSDGLEPTEIAVRLDPTSSRSTTMSVVARFASDADLDRGLDIRFVDGIKRACASAHAVI